MQDCSIRTLEKGSDAGISKPMLGRRRITPAQIIPVIHECKGLLFAAAKRLGVSYETLRKHIHKHPEVARAVYEARERVTDEAELTLYECIRRGEAWAVCFYLKTIGRARGYIERHEVSGPDGGPVPVQWIEVVKPDA